MFEDDAELAAFLAVGAGGILMALRGSSDLTGNDLGDAADKAANDFLVAQLREHRPDDALLSEEECDNPARLSASRVWIIDPLDGTREYREGRDDWAVHVGLSIDGVAEIGAVALPALDAVLTSNDGAKNGGAALTPLPSRPRMVVSRSRATQECVAVGEALGAELIPMGSAGAKAMAVVRGEADIYLHSGGQHQWDNCAPVAVARAHGLHCSRIDGAPLVYNKESTLLPDLLICRTELADEILALIKNAA